MQHLHDLAAQDGFDWLDGELLQQIHARWQARSAACGDSTRLAALLDHLHTALAHLDQAVSAYAQTCGEVGIAIAEQARVEQAWEQTGGYLQKTRLKPQLDAARQTRFDAENAQQARQGELIEAVLPPGDRLDLLFGPPSEPDALPPSTRSTPDAGQHHSKRARPHPRLRSIGPGRKQNSTNRSRRSKDASRHRCTRPGRDGDEDGSGYAERL